MVLVRSKDTKPDLRHRNLSGTDLEKGLYKSNPPRCNRLQN